MSCRRLVARPGMASLLLSLSLAAFGAAGCSEDATPPKEDTSEGTDEVAGSSDGTNSSDIAATTDDTGDTISTGSDTIATDIDAKTDNDSTDLVDGTDISDGSDTPDGGPTDDSAIATDVVVGPDVLKLKLPSCANDNCANCATKCAVQEICVNGKTYKNDCEAICSLKAFDGLGGMDVSPKKCPDCAACANIDLKCDSTSKKCVYGKAGAYKTLATSCTTNADCASAAAVCATLKSGAQITVDLPCDVECLELKPSTSDPTKPTPTINGACKTDCGAPPPKGGSCPMNQYQPVCAKQDGKTYINDCALQNCDIKGCFAVGSAAKTETCVADAMTVECVGECAADAGAPNCSTECNPTCGILPTGKGQSFRNACMAAAKSATVGSCDGITATAADKCSAGESYKGAGCCAGVDYTSVNPICAMRQEEGGKPAVWLTFRNQAEYSCLTKGDNMWVQQYVGPCVCNCNQQGPEVCGADGLTYTNKCQAECYNPGGQFSTTPGACP